MFLIFFIVFYFVFSSFSNLFLHFLIYFFISLFSNLFLFCFTFLLLIITIFDDDESWQLVFQPKPEPNLVKPLLMFVEHLEFISIVKNTFFFNTKQMFALVNPYSYSIFNLAKEKVQRETIFQIDFCFLIRFHQKQIYNFTNKRYPFSTIHYLFFICTIQLFIK